MQETSVNSKRFFEIINPISLCILAQISASQKSLLQEVFILFKHFFGFVSSLKLLVANEKL